MCLTLCEVKPFGWWWKIFLSGAQVDEYLHHISWPFWECPTAYHDYKAEDPLVVWAHEKPIKKGGHKPLFDLTKCLTLCEQEVWLLLSQFAGMKLLNGENQVPVFAPDNVAILKSEAVELSRIKVLVVLRMRMATDKITNINSLNRIIAECQANT